MGNSMCVYDTRYKTVGKKFHCSDETSFFDVRDQIANTERFMYTDRLMEYKATRGLCLIVYLLNDGWMDEGIVKMEVGDSADFL